MARYDVVYTMRRRSRRRRRPEQADRACATGARQVHDPAVGADDRLRSLQDRRRLADIHLSGEVDGDIAGVAPDPLAQPDLLRAADQDDTVEKPAAEFANELHVLRLGPAFMALRFA